MDPASRPETPSVVVKAPSTESIKSWNCNVADSLIRKSEIEAEEALKEEEEEFDPFDTTEFEEVAAKGAGVANYEDPFDTTKAANFLDEEEKAEESEESDSNEEEEVPDPFEVIDHITDTPKLNVEVIKPVQEEVEEEEADPFDTAFAAEVLPNKEIRLIPVSHLEPPERPN